jgi:hypothetical protein
MLLATSINMNLISVVILLCFVLDVTLSSTTQTNDDNNNNDFVSNERVVSNRVNTNHVNTNRATSNRVNPHSVGTVNINMLHQNRRSNVVVIGSGVKDRHMKIILSVTCKISNDIELEPLRLAKVILVVKCRGCGTIKLEGELDDRGQWSMSFEVPELLDTQYELLFSIRLINDAFFIAYNKLDTYNQYMASKEENEMWFQINTKPRGDTTHVNYEMNAVTNPVNRLKYINNEEVQRYATYTEGYAFSKLNLISQSIKYFLGISTLKCLPVYPKDDKTGYKGAEDILLIQSTQLLSFMILVHEIGHRVMLHVYKPKFSDYALPTSGDHKLCPSSNQDVMLAWVEGYANGFSLIMTELITKQVTPNIVSVTPSSGASLASGEEPSVSVNSISIEYYYCLVKDMNHNEGRIAAAMYDLFDSHNDGLDDDYITQALTKKDDYNNNLFTVDYFGRSSYSDSNMNNRINEKVLLVEALELSTHPNLDSYWEAILTLTNGDQKDLAQQIKYYNFG